LGLGNETEPPRNRQLPLAAIEAKVAVRLWYDAKRRNEVYRGVFPTKSRQKPEKNKIRLDLGDQMRLHYAA